MTAPWTKLVELRGWACKYYLVAAGCAARKCIWRDEPRYAVLSRLDYE
jgi:hypothetical protein